MKHDSRRRLLGLTWIGWTNLLLLQWFGLRLAAIVEPPDDTHVGYTVKRRWPLAGWSGQYRSLSFAWLALVVMIVMWTVRA